MSFIFRYLWCTGYLRQGGCFLLAQPTGTESARPSVIFDLRINDQRSHCKLEGKCRDYESTDYGRGTRYRTRDCPGTCRGRRRHRHRISLAPRGIAERAPALVPADELSAASIRGCAAISISLAIAWTVVRTRGLISIMRSRVSR